MSVNGKAPSKASGPPAAPRALPANLAALGEFVRGRRRQIVPDTLGIESSGRRRTPGLRREEVAALAGISTPWYTRIELGTAGVPSRATLAAVAHALRLSQAELRYLFELAGASLTILDAPLERRSAALEYAVLNLGNAAAVALDRYATPRCWNAIADGIFKWSTYGDEFQRNVIVAGLTQPRFETFMGQDYEDAVRAVIGTFRRAYTTSVPTQLADRIFEFGMGHPKFRAVWNGATVAEYYTPPGPFVRNVPEVGEVRVDFVDLIAARHDGLHVRVISPLDADSLEKFRHLESLGTPSGFQDS